MERGGVRRERGGEGDGRGGRGSESGGERTGRGGDASERGADADERATSAREAVRSRHRLRGGLHEHAASVTSLTAGPDFVIATGLCGRIRAWQAPPRARLAFLPAGASRLVVRVEVAAAPPEAWALVLDESSAYALPNARTSCHPYRYVALSTADLRFAVASPSPAAPLELWDARRWARVQSVDAAAHEAPREEWARRGVRGVRASCSCVALRGGWLACGTREAEVHLWRGKPRVAPHRRGLTADRGPVGALALTESLVLAAYRQRAGLVDGDAFCGEQSVVAWRLESGEVAWRIRPAAAAPAVGLERCGARAWVLHAHPSVREADWNLLFAAEGGAEGAEGAVVAAAAPPDGRGEWRAARGGGGGAALPPAPLLCWHADGARLSLGFCGGGVALLPDAAEGEAKALRGAAGGADVAAVQLLRADGGGGPLRADGGGGPLLASACAAGCVRLWRVEGGALEVSALLRLAPPLQPCRLAAVGPWLVCGCADGSLVGVTREDFDEAGGGGGGGGGNRYEWQFDAMAGEQARGAVRQKRRAFDGWARTEAYEQGLQEVLARMNGKSGEGGTRGAPAPAGTGEGPPRGALYRLDGLQSRPELNGRVVLVIAAADPKSGRVPVRVLPAHRESRAEDIKVRPHNLVRLRPDEQIAVAPPV
ncbi:hypothetical protein AB1Y20_009357 [Prymnesium parvum]|uniref:Uncharacterized protein n=1 Tax=Prymnesium parvum TaxID=97485 RepID=A0AB34K4U8_PRYPA